MRSKAKNNSQDHHRHGMGHNASGPLGGVDWTEDPSVKKEAGDEVISGREYDSPPSTQRSERIVPKKGDRVHAKIQNEKQPSRIAGDRANKQGGK